MANILRTDSSDFQRPAANQPPIVLARLPRVGTEQAATTTKVQAQGTPPPEHIPYLDLQTDIARQTRLHIADTTSDEAIPNTRHFADHRHPENPAAPTSRVRMRQQSSASEEQLPSDKPTTLSERLFQLHAQVAPHAGLIVALALIASAGLLYWMIVGPAQPPMPHYDYGTEFSDEGFGSISNYTPEFIAEMPQPVAIAQPSKPSPAEDQWEEVFRSTPAQVQQQPSEPEQPEPQPALEPTSLQPLPSTDDSAYPKTDFPDKLPFAVLRPTQASDPKLDASQSYPEVAGRPRATTTR